MKTPSRDRKTNDNKEKDDINEDEVRAKWASSGAMPKLFGKTDDQATPLGLLICGTLSTFSCCVVFGVLDFVI